MKLTQEQEGTLVLLRDAKQRYTAGRQVLDARHQNAVDDLKRDIRETVEDALSRGVPKRQIHLALGFGQSGQLDNFLAVSRAEESGAPVASPVTAEEAEEAPVVETEVRIVETGTQGRQVYDVDGSLVLEYLWMPTDGAFVMGAVTPHLTEEPPARIKDAICAQTTKPILVKISPDIQDDVDLTIWNI